jgi:hypothetical protein
MTAPSGNFTDGSVGDYQASVECDFMISPNGAPDQIIEITFNYFDTQYLDFVTVYDGDSEEDYILGEFSGQIETPFTVNSSQASFVVISFVSLNDRFVVCQFHAYSVL